MKLTFQAASSSAALLMGLMFALGCGDSGPKKTTVNGHVKQGGDLLNRGVVLFSPVNADSPPSRTNIQPDGTYQIDVVPGEHKVVVNLFTETDPSIEPGAPGYVAPKSLIPRKYSSVNQTPLQFTVGEEPIDIDLEL